MCICPLKIYKCMRIGLVNNGKNREMQIKTTMWCHFTHNETVIVKKKRHSMESIIYEVEKLESLSITVENVQWYTYFGKVTISQKVKMLVHSKT